MYPIEYSVPARESGGVSDPDYLAHLVAAGRAQLTAFIKRITADQAIQKAG